MTDHMPTCDVCTTPTPVDDLAQLVVYGIETAACAACRLEPGPKVGTPHAKGC